MTGTCRFCGQVRMIRYAEGKTQEDLDRIASDECNCEGAQREQKAQYEESKAKTAIRKVIGQRFPDAAEVLLKAAGPAAREKIKSVSIGLGNGAKATLVLGAKGELGVKLSETIVTTMEDAVEMEQVRDEA